LLSEGAAVKSRMREYFKSGSVRDWEARKVWRTLNGHEGENRIQPRGT